MVRPTLIMIRSWIIMIILTRPILMIIRRSWIIMIIPLRPICVAEGEGLSDKKPSSLAYWWATTFLKVLDQHD